MNIKKAVIVFSIPLILSSCSKGFIRYGVNPYIEVEKMENGQIIDKLPSDIKNKMENKDSFVLFLHKNGCDYCDIAIKDHINPFLNEHNIVIFGINLSDIYRSQNELDIYNDIVKPFNNNDEEGNRYVPHLSIIHEGNFIQGELDMKFYTLLIESYIIL